MGLREFFSVEYDKATTGKLEADMRAAGAKGVDALKAAMAVKMADLKHDLSAGLIDEAEFRRQSKRAADAMDHEIRAAMQRLVAAGKENTEEYAKLGATLQHVGKLSTDNAGVFTRAWGGIKSMVTGIGAAIVASFTVRAVVDFAKASVAAAQESDRAWRGLGAALGNVGLSFDKLGPQIQRTLGVIGKRAAFDTDDLAKSLGALVDMTGDYNLSLQAMSVAADLARAKQIPLEQATELVGRALETGNARGLVPFVGKLKEGEPILGQIAAKIGDVTERMSPFERGAANTAIAWDNLKEGIGAALIAGVEGASVFDTLTGLLEDLTGWIVRNKDTIAAWAVFFINEIAIVGKGVGNIFYGLGQVFSADSNFWRSIRIAILSTAQEVLGVVLKVQNAMLEMSKALPGDPFADQIRSAMERTSGYIGALGTKIAEQSAGMKRDLGADDPSATRTDSLGGGLASNVGGGADRAAGKIKDLGDKTKDLADKTKAHMQEMSEAYADAGAAFDSRYTGSILAGKDRIIEAHKALDAQRAMSTEDLQRAQENIQSAYIATGDAATTAGSAIERATREAIAAKQAEREAQEQVQAAAQNYAYDYITQITPAIEQRSEQVAKKMAGDAKGAAAETKTSWLDSMSVLTGALTNLANVAGGMFGQLLSGLSGVANGITAASAGFKAFSDVTAGGLTGIIQKVAGLAGGVSGVIGLISSVPGVIDALGDIGGAIGGALGINRDKDPGRLESNYRAWQLAYKGNAEMTDATGAGLGMSALDFLLLKSPTAYGGGGGWATDKAQQDAWAKFQQAIQGLNAAGQLPDQYKQYLGGGTAKTASTASAPAPAPTTSWSSPLSTGGGGGTNPWGLQTFHEGGWMKGTGLAMLRDAELVLPPELAAGLASVVLGQSGAPSGGPTTDARQLHLGPIYVSGLPDEVPQRVVDRIEERLGQGFQRDASLRGNALLSD
jgi:hypothetical protein